jgi:uncharacterized protein (DUF58 family)
VIATVRTLQIWAGLAVIGFVVAWLGVGYEVWGVLAAGVVVATVADGWIAWRRSAPKVERTVANSLPLGVDTEVMLRMVCPDGVGGPVEIFDGVPEALGAPEEALSGVLSGEKATVLRYRIHPHERGRFSFEQAYLRRPGPLGLMARQVRVGPEEERVRVVPNFRAVSSYALMAVADQMGRLGVRRLRRRGEGMEFDSLREYREGDQLRQVDWKATAKHRRVITRQYEDERNQQVVLLFDCGRRMRARDGELSHFDHALNAGLLLSFVALQQGDSVAVGTFGGPRRWVPSQRGVRAVETIVDQTFDLQTTTEPSDFSEAARWLSHLQRRRSLIVFLTNMYDADSDELDQALALLGQRHVILVASLRETAVEELKEAPVEYFDDALQVSATHAFLDHRRELHGQLARSGGLLLDVQPSELSVSLVNRYLEIKRSGRL